MYMLVSGGDLLQREAVMRLKWFEFYMTLRLLKEKSERDKENLKGRAKPGKKRNNG